VRPADMRSLALSLSHIEQTCAITLMSNESQLQTQLGHAIWHMTWKLKSHPHFIPRTHVLHTVLVTNLSLTHFWIQMSHRTWDMTSAYPKHDSFMCDSFICQKNKWMWKNIINSFVTESRALKRDASVWETWVRECVILFLSRTSAVEATRPHHTTSCSWAANNSSGLVWRAQRRAADSRAWATAHSAWLAGKMQWLPHRCRRHIDMCICILSCVFRYMNIVMCIHVYILSAPVVLSYVCV